MKPHSYSNNVPREQRFAQGGTAKDNGIDRQVRQTRSVQPGNTFWRTLRIATNPIGS